MISHCTGAEAAGTTSRQSVRASDVSVGAGAVNHNLQAMKQRVNSTLVTFESVTRALEVTASQLKKEQAHAVSC